MATLYVENVPEDLYEALRARARKNRKSMAAEVVTLLEQTIPTAKELNRRARLLQQVLRLAPRRPPGSGPFSPASKWFVRTGSGDHLRGGRKCGSKMAAAGLRRASVAASFVIAPSLHSR